MTMMKQSISVNIEALTFFLLLKLPQSNENSADPPQQQQVC